MKKTLRICPPIVLLLFALQAKTQTCSLGLLADYSTLTHREMKTLGLTAELFCGKNRRVALNYNVRIGETRFFNYKNKFDQPVNGSGLNYKVTPGLVLCYFLATNYKSWGTGKDDWKVMVAALLVPEGFTYYTDIKKQYGHRYTHFRSGYKTGHRLGFYCNPLSVEGWELYKQNQSEARLCLETGLKADFKLSKRISLKPYIGFRMQYNHVFIGFNSGLSINVNSKR